MISASIILPKKLREKLKEKAAEAGYLPDELCAELLCTSLNEELEPEDLIEQYQVLSDKYFNDAKELLKEDDLVQASEKLWGAAALTVKMVAVKRGLKLEEQGSLWDFLNTLSKERKDKQIIRLFYTASALHQNFYEAQMNKEVLEIALGDVEILITKLKRLFVPSRISISSIQDFTVPIPVLAVSLKIWKKCNMIRKPTKRKLRKM